jgi:hypothetical protein
VVVAKIDHEARHERDANPRQVDSTLAADFRTRAMEAFGRHEKSLQLAQDEALRLWLAWRGDPSYLIVKLSDRSDRDSAWRVVKFTEIPRLTTERDYVEARSLGLSFPENVLAHFTRFVLQELDRTPGAEAEAVDNPDGRITKLSRQAVLGGAFGRLTAGDVLTVRWPSNVAPGLPSRIVVLSKGAFQDSKYPAFDRGADARRGTDRGFTKFLERAEKKHQQRWVRWVTRG